MLITGGTGFIGHYLVKEFVQDYNIICLVRHGTKNIDRFEEVIDQITVIEHDLQQDYTNLLLQLKDVEVILHCGGNPSAESSMRDPVGCVKDNVLGTMHLLELARQLPIKRFFYYSANEIFGPVPKGTSSLEYDAYHSVSPYSASKAGGEELCVAYSNIWKIPVSILHLTNTFGPRSQSNRYPVILLKKLLHKEPVQIHVDPDGGISGRCWFYAGNVASQTRFLLDNQSALCDKWNSSGTKFIDNLELAHIVADILNIKLEYNIIPVDRPGHDAHFSLNSNKIYAAGWQEPIDLMGRLIETAQWYKNNPNWLIGR